MDERTFQITRTHEDRVVTLTFGEIEGRLEVVAVEVYAEGRGLRSSDLRLPLQGLVESARAELATRWAPLVARTLSDRVAGVLRLPGSRQGRRGYPEVHWAAVRAVVDGSRHPVADVAKTFVVSRGTAKDWVARVRQPAT